MASRKSYSSSSDSSSILTSQIQNEFKSIQRSAGSAVEAKQKWRDELQGIVETALPGSRLVLVGSSTNLFCFQNSDCDLTVITKQSYVSVIECLRKIEAALRPLRRRFDIELVSRAKVPVLKLKDNETSLEGDINVNSHRNIFHAYLFRCYVHLDSRVQPLGLVIKLWAKKAGIINQRDHKLSGFTLLVLYIHYLQVGCSPPVVPMLQSAYPEHFKESIPSSTIIDHITTNHQPEPLRNFVSQNKQNLGELFVGFFRFYSSFNWSKVISIRRSSGFVSNRRTHIQIEDPYGVGENSARGIYEWYGFSEIKKAFSDALKKLENDLSLENLL